MTLVPEARALALEEAAAICDAKAAKWRKAAQNHLPHWNSAHAKADLNRAEICEGLANEIRAAIARAKGVQSA